MSEIYRTIQGYEGLYQISNYGNVKSIARDVEWRGTIRHYPERILKPVANSCGYMYVNLCLDGKAKPHYVHRLVANTFIENPDGLPQVNHKDEDKTNNCAENLEWCTHEYNLNYGTRIQRIAETMTNGKLSIPIDMLTKQGEFIRQFPSARETERFLRNNGFHKASHTAINQCCKGKLYKSCYGFKWRYAQGN